MQGVDRNLLDTYHVQVLRIIYFRTNLERLRINL